MLHPPCLSAIPSGLSAGGEFSSRLLRATEHPLAASHLEAGPPSSLIPSTGADLNALGQKGPSKGAPSASGSPDVLTLSLQISAQMPSHGMGTVTADKCDGRPSPWKHLESCILCGGPIIQIRKLGALRRAHASTNRRLGCLNPCLLSSQSSVFFTSTLWLLGMDFSDSG